MKIDREGQASTLSDSDYSKIRKQIKSKKYKLLLDLAQEPAKDGGRWYSCGLKIVTTRIRVLEIISIFALGLVKLARTGNVKPVKYLSMRF
jgi:hypothetical protein